jgi:hypothetical protein
MATGWWRIVKEGKIESNGIETPVGKLAGDFFRAAFLESRYNGFVFFTFI